MTHGTDQPAAARDTQIASADGLAVMVVKIGFIIFVVEILIMLGLYSLEDAVTVGEGMLDATILTLVASPLIYLWVARPFAEDAAAARSKLAVQLAATRSLLDQNVMLKERLQEFSAASADIHERTLQRIGAELHDGPAQTLTFSLLQVDRMLRAIERNQIGNLASVAAELRNVIHESAHEVRGISTGLALPELHAMTLREVVELAVNRHKLATGLTAQIDFHSACQPSQSHKACIYRVVQESLTNATKHSKADTVTVSVVDADGLTVAISDNGQGFDKTQTLNKGLGLLGMRARVEALRGRFELKSSPESGTTIVAHFESPNHPQGGQHD